MRSSGLLLALLLASCSGGDSPSPGYERDCRQAVFFRPESGASQPSVVGDFNGWTAGAHPLEDPDGDGTFHAVLDLAPGWHLYRIRVGEQTRLDPFNPLTLYDSTGVENSAILFEDCALPALEWAQVDIVEGNLDAHLRFLRANSGSPFDMDGLGAVLEGEAGLVTVEADLTTGDLRVRSEGLSPGKHRLEVTARDQNGVEAVPASVPFWVEDVPFDWQDAVIYQVMVDRFRRGGSALDGEAPISDYHGGDLQGVTEAIEEGYFERLGVNVLWLSPLYENPEGHFTGRDGYPAEAYHGYWPVEPRRVESRFGGEEALDALVQEAHARGMRVLMDAVPNHVHRDHPYFVQYKDQDWFNHPEGDCVCGFSCSWGDFIESCWFDPFLPDLDFANSQVVEQVSSDATWWLRRFDLDGLRVDAVPMMPRLALRHIRDRIGRELESGGTHVYLLGETYTGRGGQPVIRYYLGPHTLSGQFDFPVMWALRDSLAGRIPFTDLDEEVRDSERAWEGSGAVMAPILGNHDVPRFVSDVNDDVVWLPREEPPSQPDRDKPYDLLKMAWAFLLTQPGAPVIYYGDEFGMPGGSDPDNRRNMRFGQQLSGREAGVLDWLAKLGRARACSEALRRGSRRTLLVHENLYAYVRDAGDGYPVVVVLNRATVPREVDLNLDESIALSPGVQFTGLSGASATLSGRNLSVDVGPRSPAVLFADQGCIEVNP